jgi:acyl-CoA thioester hydrolase
MRARLSGYNLGMDTFRFHHPIQIRYGDLDPQWHVNNAHTLTMLEHARFAYLMELGLFDGKSFLDLGLIVADVHISYQAPIKLDQEIHVLVRTSRIGTKSMTLEYQIVDLKTDDFLAKAETVMVAYDYHAHKSVPVQDAWRQKISTYEGQSF